jgi:2-polyprenyl-3-methyl-5-hydroxy-6-metoxy-1,4-benzoquinol methylase
LKNLDYKYHYQKDAELFDYFENNKYDNDYNNRLHSFITNLIKNSNNYILDVGSGGGWTASKLKHKGNLFLTDVSYKNLHVIKTEKNVKAIAADAMALPYKNEMFDYIIISEVLEHINEPNKVIANLITLLKNGGKIIITTPYNEKIKYNLCIHCNQITPSNAHLHSFNIESMKNICSDFMFSSLEFYKLGNKALTVTRLSYILRFLPFFLWRIIDKTLNLFIDKPNTLITVITK